MTDLRVKLRLTYANGDGLSQLCRDRDEALAVLAKTRVIKSVERAVIERLDGSGSEEVKL